jgi:lipid II:glycine glycyltransferase (peptidoglycan interpeptide bridge formation enzyme)
MPTQIITQGERNAFNTLATHPLQSYEWGEFRENTGVKVIRRGIFEKNQLIDGFQLTIHPIPHTPWHLGYLPKSKLPTKELIRELQNIGKEENCVAIQLEPNVIKDKNTEHQLHDLGLRASVHPLFTKYTFLLDLTKSEEELLQNMHSKTRYNIRVAQKHDVIVTEDNSKEAFEAYIQLTHETTTRQRFYAHSESYHRQQWEILPHTHEKEKLTSHLLTAKYNQKILTAWIVFMFHDTLYYPYGASTNKHREVMANNLIMWEAIRFGKKHGLKSFDMWGAADVEQPEPSHPYYGFHRFKQGYGATYTEFVGSYDLVIHPLLYKLYAVADKARWFLLRLKK